MPNLKQRVESEANRAQLVTGLGGEAGSKIEAGTTANAGEFKAIQVLTDAVFDATTAGNMEGLGGSTILAGTILHGLWTNVKLTSGSVVLYRC